MKNRIHKITIPNDQTKFFNGKPVLEKEDFFGVMVEGKAVFIGKEYLKGEPEISETSFSCELPYWFIEKKGLEIFIDTSSEPSLFD